jgi:hypothetical protein
VDTRADQIVLTNRHGVPSLDVLAAQVTALARLVAKQTQDLDAQVATGSDNGRKIGARLVKGAIAATPARVIGTSFQPSATSPTLVIYTVQLAVAATLGSPQTVTVDLRVDVVDPPVASVGTASLTTSQTAGLSISTSLTSQGQLVGWVPPGSYVNLVVSGGGTATLVSQTEVPFDG